MMVLTCPRDGGKLVVLKTRVLSEEVEDSSVSGYWCENGHKLDEHESPIDIEESLEA